MGKPCVALGWQANLPAGPRESLQDRLPGVTPATRAPTWGRGAAGLMPLDVLGRLLEPNLRL